jgi:hypothetical protein
MTSWHRDGETDVTFRQRLRESPQPFFQLAFPHKRVVPLGPLIDPSAEGSAEVTRTHLYKVLEWREFPLTPEARTRIEAEADAARLEAWYETAHAAASLADVFRDG